MLEMDDSFFKYVILGRTYQLPFLDMSSKTKERILMEATILFAQYGYNAVSMRDIGDKIGIKPSSLYSHFSSKEVLWGEILAHTEKLYKLYIDLLGEEMSNAKSYNEALEILFFEPKKLTNIFTCFAFSLIMIEQFRDAHAAEIYNKTFLGYGISRHKMWLDRCIEEGFIEEFNTLAVATLFINTVMAGLNAKVQEVLGREPYYDPSAMYADLEVFLQGLRPVDKEAS
ncbi:MAG: TetR/AcrR family transcriptional regulator [Clostridiales Family XIII bacterium]|jgi:AcrR family transcriptional regulator|nr:TetR/AcrR family transcriptional regulator [Clostridiales Family XIII bacterium]